MIRGICRLVDDLIHGKEAEYPSTEYLERLYADTHLRRIYQFLENSPLNEDELAKRICLPGWKLDEYLGMMKDRKAIRREFFGERYVLAPQGGADIGYAKTFAIINALEPVHDKLTRWQKWRILMSDEYGFEMCEKYEREIQESQDGH